MVSTISKWPIFTPVRRCCAWARHAHRFWPPATTISLSPFDDRPIAERDRAQARAAELVDAPGRAFHRDAGAHRGLAGRVLACARAVRIWPMMTSLTREPSTPAPLKRAENSDACRVHGRAVGKSPVEGADRRTGGAYDDDDRPSSENSSGGRNAQAGRAHYGAAASSARPRGPVSGGNLAVRPEMAIFGISARDAATPQSLPRRHKTVTAARRKPVVRDLGRGSE